MRVLHSVFRYFPDRGGSETYVSALIRGLGARGVENIIASSGEPPAEFTHEGVPVHRLGDVLSSSLEAQAKSAVDYTSRLRDLVTECSPDVLHLHYHPASFSNELLNGWLPPCPLVLTYHHPGVVCLRGDLLRFGRAPCTGVFDRQLCLPCISRKLGMPSPLAGLFPFIPDSVGLRLARILPRGKLRTVASMGAAVSRRMSQNHALLRASTHVFVLAQWTRDMLIDAGVSVERVQVSRIGTHNDNPGTRAASRRSERLRGIFVGRLDHFKGIPLIAQAMQRLPNLPLEVDAFGPLETADRELVPLIEAGKHPDARLRFRGTLPDSEVVKTMHTYDFAIVCSQSFETGPYVVIEAFQAGLPVLGTDIGGINELVAHDHNGWLVPLGSVEGWKLALQKITEDRSALDRWRTHAQWQRTMNDVAGEVLAAYVGIVPAKNR